MEAAWGSIAEWAGVIVTLLGFIGAILAIYFQQKNAARQEILRDESEKAEHQKYAKSISFDSDIQYIGEGANVHRLSSAHAQTHGAHRYKNVSIIEIIQTSGGGYFANAVLMTDSLDGDCGLWSYNRSETMGEFSDRYKRRLKVADGRSEGLYFRFTDPNGTHWTKDAHGNLTQESA